MKSKILVAILLAAGSVAANAADLPKSCQDYFNKVDEMVKKYPQAAAGYKSVLDQQKQAWEKTFSESKAGADAVETGCKAASDQMDAVFKQM